MYTRLNHLNVCLSYNATLTLILDISEDHTLPLQQWIAEDSFHNYFGVIMWTRRERSVMYALITKVTCCTCTASLQVKAAHLRNHFYEQEHLHPKTATATMQDYLDPSDRRVASGGDHLTCERQLGARHLMDGDTPRDRLELLEPQAEDWHCLVCVLGVSKKRLTLVHYCV